MAYALRIDDVRQDPDGMFSVDYTEGTAPLPVAAQRKGFRVNGPQEIRDMLDDQSRADLLRVLFLMAMARFRQVDPDMDSPALIEGRTITFDATTNNIVVIT